MICMENCPSVASAGLVAFAAEPAQNTVGANLARVGGFDASAAHGGQ
jgi:hypothetical protein